MEEAKKAAPKQGAQPDYNKINEYVKDFLKFNKYMSTLECFEAEERTKVVTGKMKQLNQIPPVSPFKF